MPALKHKYFDELKAQNDLQQLNDLFDSFSTNKVVSLLQLIMNAYRVIDSEEQLLCNRGSSLRLDGVTKNEMAMKYVQIY